MIREYLLRCVLALTVVMLFLANGTARAASETYERGLEQYFRGEWSAAMESFEEALRNGEPEADYYIARLYAMPGYESFDLEKSAHLLMNASNRGDVEAFRLLFDLFYAYDGDETIDGDFPVVSSTVKCGSGSEIPTGSIMEFLLGRKVCFGIDDLKSVADIIGIIGSHRGQGGPQYQKAVENCGAELSVDEIAQRLMNKRLVRFRPGCATYATRQMEFAYRNAMEAGEDSPELEHLRTAIIDFYSLDAYLGFTLTQTYLGAFLMEYGNERQREEGEMLLFIAGIQGDETAKNYFHTLASETAPMTPERASALITRYRQTISGQDRLAYSTAGKMQIFSMDRCEEDINCEVAGIMYYDQCRPFHRQQDYRKDFFQLGGFTKCLREAWARVGG